MCIILFIKKSLLYSNWLTLNDWNIVQKNKVQNTHYLIIDLILLYLDQCVLEHKYNRTEIIRVTNNYFFARSK